MLHTTGEAEETGANQTKCNSSPSVATPHTHMGRAELELLLHKLGIEYHVKEHQCVMTVAELLQAVGDMPGLHMKNLFVKDKKSDQLYLIGARHDAKVLTQ